MPRKTSAKSGGTALKRPAADPAATDLKEGVKVPAFRIPRDEGGFASLKDFAGRNAVLFFYPRAGTPGCTLEAVDFDRLAPAFEAVDTSLLGISADPLPALQRFRTKQLLSIPLASDEELTMLPRYSVWGEKSMYGKTFLGVLRTTLWIDSAGRAARIWRNVKVKGHADAVLDAIRNSVS